MRRDLIDQNRKRIYGMLGAVAGIFLLYGGVLGGAHLMAENNEKKAAELLSQITYTEDHVEEDITKLEEFRHGHYLSDDTTGKIYKALAELSYMTGDDMIYNKYVATALFYLEGSQDKDSVVYLTNNYMGRLYANGCYTAAEDLLENLASNYEISDFPLDIQAAYYLSRADLAQMVGNDGDEFLREAQAAILLVPDSKEKNLNQAKLDLLTARHEMVNDRWKEAQDILLNYSLEDSFGYEKDQVYVVCNFKIPYEELMTKLLLNEHEVAQAEKYMLDYISLCDQYQFRAMELNLLKYVNRHPDMKKLERAGSYDELERDVLQRNLNEITSEYAQILLTDMNNTKENLRLGQERDLRKQRGIFCGVIVLNVLLVSGLAALIIVDVLNRDGLTKLSNRKKYEALRLECDRKKIPYGFLILDVDDFKKVNDTLGHDQGDVVLSGIADIILQYVGRGIYGFRYGGEEMCVMFLNVPEKRVAEIAEEIRSKIEQQQFVDQMKITVSGGLCMSEHGESVFVQADRKLYEAKRSGKNRVII